MDRVQTEFMISTITGTIVLVASLLWLAAL